MKSIVAIACVVGWSFSMAQDNVQPLTLKACLEFAQINSPLNDQIKLTRERSSAKTDLAKSPFLPQLAAYTEYRQYIDNPTFFFPTNEGQILSGGNSNEPYPVRLGQKFNVYAGATLSQVLFDKRWVRSREMSSLGNELVELSAQQITEQIILNVSTLYYEIQKLQQKDRLLVQSMEQLDRLSNLVTLQLENDVAKKSDFDKLELQRQDLKIQQQLVQNTTNLLLERLKYVMGMPFDTNLVMAEPSFIDEPLAQATSPTTSSKLLEQQQKISQLEIQNIADGYFPSVKGYLDIQFQAQRTEFNFVNSDKWFPRHFFGVGINFPILTGFEKKAKVALEQVRLKEIQLERDRLSQEESFQLRDAQNQLANTELKLDYHRRNKEMHERLFAQMNLEFNEGISSLAEVIGASSAQIEAANQYEEAFFEYKLAQINYLKASAGLENLLL